jgi:hypothetical protein
MSMSKSNYIYISSKNRNSNENIYNFNVILNNPIIVNRNQGINISVVGFSMLNTDYNLKNCSFYLNQYNLDDEYIITFIYDIPDGNYSYLTLMNFLNSDEELKQFIKIDYIKERNSFKFTKIDNTKIYKIDPLNCDKFLGLKKEEETEITSQGIEGSYINLTNYSHIIIKSNNILFEDNTQDNIDNVDFGNSSILFKIDKQDIPPFQLISYRNYDKSDNYSYNISNRQINSIDLHLYNEKGEVLKDTDDYFITLKIVIFNKEEIKPDTYLEDIRFLLMNLIFNNKKKNIILE